MDSKTILDSHIIGCQNFFKNQFENVETNHVIRGIVLDCKAQTVIRLTSIEVFHVFNSLF